MRHIKNRATAHLYIFGGNILGQTRNTQDEINRQRPIAVIIAVLIVIAALAYAFFTIKPIENVGDSQKVVASKLFFEEKSIELLIDEQSEIKPSFLPDNVTEKELTFTCDDKNIAAVDQTGTIIGVSLGETIVHVLNPESGLTAELTVKVVEKHSESTSETTRYDISVTTKPTEATTTAESETTVDIPRETQVVGLTLSFYNTTLRIGEKKMPIVTLKPWGVKNKKEIWTSSDESVARVDKYGGT